NGANDIPLTANDAAPLTFTFVKTLFQGENYSVTIKTQPTGQPACKVIGGTGSVGSANVDDIVVSCLQGKYFIGGNITGLEGSITLTNNGGDQINLSNGGTYAFPTPLDNGMPFAVAITGHSLLPEQTCGLANESGNVAGADVTNVNITCTTKSYD